MTKETKIFFNKILIIRNKKILLLDITLPAH